MEFGKMIDFLLSTDGFTLEEISRGICTRSYLSMCRSGAREMNAIVFYSIIRRPYLSPNRFNILLNRREHEYFKLLYDVYDAVAAGNYGFLETIEFEELEEYFKNFGHVVRHDMSFFRYIYTNEAEKDAEKAYCYLKSSVDYMIDSDGTLRKGRYGTEDLNRFLNFIKLSVDLNKITKKKAKRSLDQILSVMTLKKRDPREEARLYPRMICFILNLAGEMYSYKRWIYLLDEALKRLVETSRCYELPEVLRLLILAESAEGSNLRDRHQKWYEAVLTVYSETGTDPSFNEYDSYDRNIELSLINEYIRRSRLDTGDKKTG